MSGHPRSLRTPRCDVHMVLAIAVQVFLTLAAMVAAASVSAAHAAEPGELLISFRAGPGAAVELERHLDAEYGLRASGHYELGALGRGVITVTAADADAMLARLARDPQVGHVQRNRQHAVAGMPAKDPYFDLQKRTRGSGVDAMLRTGSGRNVRIAVIDTGVDRNHPELAGRLTTAINFVGANADAVPGEFHGTSVVGLIAAAAGNGVGIHGLAPDAEIHALRACWEPTYAYGLCSTNTLAQALNYAIEVRARIVNLSLAGPEDPLLAQLVARAIELGAVVFGAVGEDAMQSFPASITGVIGVEQRGIEDGDRIDTALIVPGRQLLTTVPDGRYDFVSGSSFATAQASGVAAVMLEQLPHLGADELLDWLRRLHGS